MIGVTRIAAIAAAVGAATSGGVFFGFSTFVMQALKRLPARDGLAAMQSINRAAPNPLFMTALFGTAAVGTGLALVALTRRDEPWVTPVIVGSALYLAGTALTIVYHVPRNEALAVLDPDDSGSATAWLRYATDWSRWNHVRTLTSLAAATSFTWALAID